MRSWNKAGWIAGRVSFPLILFASASIAGSYANAGQTQINAEVAAEIRGFPSGPQFTDQKNVSLSPSLSMEGRIVHEWNNKRDQFVVSPFLRWDADDEERSHADVREGYWLHAGNGWDVLVGVNRVFWGVTESRHLVNIINQDDTVEDIDGEDKLGQPMINLNLIRDWGNLSAFVLPYFRERTFPEDDARLRGALPIDTGAATYDSTAKETHIDLALRWAGNFGNWDIGISEFLGTSREPRLVQMPVSGGNVVLVPHYDQIDQTGIDAQFTKGAWLWKLEAMTRGGHGDRFAALVGGIEYTVFSVFQSRSDLGLLMEYLYDGRDQSAAPPTIFDDDLFVGLRLALNDEKDSAALLGAVIDTDTGATFLSLEASRRLGGTWKTEIEARFFMGIPNADPLAGIRRDDFVTLKLTKFF